MFRATGGEGDVKVRSERGIRRGVMGTLAAAGMCLMLVAARGQAGAAGGGQAARNAQGEQPRATGGARPALLAVAPGGGGGLRGWGAAATGHDQAYRHD